MCAAPIRDFMHFLGIEKENILKSTINLGDNFPLVVNLDILYRKCLDLSPINKPEHKIPCFLYLISHNELYLAVANFLRLHQSKSFCNLRSALDATFTAYYLLKNPDKRKIYLSSINLERNIVESKKWNKIFRNIKETIKKDIKNFPLAKHLPEVHEFCSIYSHSDALGLLHRYKEDKTKLMLEAEYFDYEPNMDNYNRWFCRLLGPFFTIFLIFWHELFKPMSGDKLNEIEDRIRAYQDRMEIYIKKYSFKKDP